MRRDLHEAEALAGRIRAYWQAKGLAPAVWVEQRMVTASSGDADRRVPVVCSDMLGGWPKTSQPAIRALPGQHTTVCPVCRHWLPNGLSGLTARPPAANAARYLPGVAAAKSGGARG
jgi:hypothetical protein